MVVGYITLRVAWVVELVVNQHGAGLNSAVRKDVSGQIITTSAEVTLNGGLVREIPLFQENLGW